MIYNIYMNIHGWGRITNEEKNFIDDLISNRLNIAGVKKDNFEVVKNFDHYYVFFETSSEDIKTDIQFIYDKIKEIHRDIVMWGNVYTHDYYYGYFVGSDEFFIDLDYNIDLLNLHNDEQQKQFKDIEKKLSHHLEKLKI